MAIQNAIQKVIRMLIQDHESSLNRLFTLTIKLFHIILWAIQQSIHWHIHPGPFFVYYGYAIWFEIKISHCQSLNVMPVPKSFFGTM